MEILSPDEMPAFDQQPEKDRQKKPSQRSSEERQSGVVAGQKAVENEGEERKGESSEEGSRGVNAGRNAAAFGSVVAGSLLRLLFVTLNKGGRGGEDGGEGQEEAADDGAVAHGDEAGCRGNEAPEEKPDRVIMRLGGFD